jgi:hypothetical protein
MPHPTTGAAAAARHTPTTGVAAVAPSLSFSKPQRSTASPATFMGASEGLDFCPDVFGAFSFMNNARVRPSKPCGFRRSCRVHVSNQRTNSAFLSRCGFWLVKLCRSRRCHCPDEFASVRPFCQPSQIRDSGPIVVPPPAPALKGLCSLSLMRAESNKVHRRGRSRDCVLFLNSVTPPPSLASSLSQCSIDLACCIR